MTVGRRFVRRLVFVRQFRWVELSECRLIRYSGLLFRLVLSRVCLPVYPSGGKDCLQYLLWRRGDCFRGTRYQVALDRVICSGGFQFGQLCRSYLFVVKLRIYSNRQALADEAVFEVV